MVEIEQPNIESEEMSDEQAIMKIAAAMKDNAPATEDKVNVHTFLLSVVQSEKINNRCKVSNLLGEKDCNELGMPTWNVRGGLGMALISDKIMDNNYFKEYFEADAGITLDTSLSRNGFLIRQATTTTKAVADVTRRRKINKGMFGKKSIDEQGGDPYNRQGGNE